MTQPIRDGQTIPLINRLDLFDQKDYPVRYDLSGSYFMGRGVLRHIVVACVGFANDWTAYEGWAKRDMNENEAITAVARNGDKIFYDRAKQFAEAVEPQLLKRHYRL